MITKKELKNLAELARIEIPAAEEEKLIRDLDNILGHFKELQAVPTENVRPMAGGTFKTNVMRSDAVPETAVPGADPTTSFPESKGGFLKVPSVFSAEGGSASGGE